MHPLLTLGLTAIAALPLTHAQTTSPKRGLVHIPSSNPADDTDFVSTRSSLTWYYNYVSLPSDSIAGTPAGLKFVPMLWGDHDNNFVRDVRSQLPDVEYVLGFNEPDMDISVGGSNISPERAVELWRSDIEPLAKDGVKLGAPGVSGAPTGVGWIKSFMEKCEGCTVDFIPVHWYGGFEGLAGHLGHFRALFPNQTLWVTELGFADQDAYTTESYFNTTLEYLDRIDYVTHYSWFGAFRSDVSNVGPSGAMLDGRGRLTDLGAWYLGNPATGVKGTSESESRAGGNSAAGRNAVSMLLAGVVAAVGVVGVW